MSLNLLSNFIFNTNSMVRRNSNVLFSKSKAANGTAFSNDDVLNIERIEAYKQLNVVIRELDSLMTQYAEGNIVAVASTLTPDFFNKMALRLYSLKKNRSKFPDYEVVRLGFSNALEGLNRSAKQNALLINTENERDNYLVSHNILHDRDKLLEFVESLNNQYTAIFGDRQDMSLKVRATIGREYTEYIRLYGLPIGGFFDADKLAQIILKFDLQNSYN
mgnify:CR=1 FL=1|tara:strand:+ start:1881 stop:2537 length:657 start_codon:yes stop_codon:yes gene_type:complete